MEGNGGRSWRGGGRGGELNFLWLLFVVIPVVALCHNMRLPLPVVITPLLLDRLKFDTLNLNLLLPSSGRGRKKER